jgi:hypothetical protein
MTKRMSSVFKRINARWNGKGWWGWGVRPCEVLIATAAALMMIARTDAQVPFPGLSFRPPAKKTAQ